MTRFLFATLIACGLSAGGLAETTSAADRPNILFCIADDWGWPDAGAYGNKVIATPAFDRLAREGVLFENAFVSSPSCTPSRNAILTGQYHWRLEEGGNLWSTLHPRFPVYPLLLAESGYRIGHWRKAWGPGNYRALGRKRDPAGPTYKGFADFLSKRPKGTPFCFWLGASDPHRPYAWQSGAKSGIAIDRITLPADFPDHETVRHDVADYYFEVQRFDRDVAAALKLLEASGELDNTIVVMTGDHGMPFPRHKCHLYDAGTHVPLAIRWGDRIKAGRRVTDLVSFTDLAPTFLELAGVTIPSQVTGRSLVPLLDSQKSGQVDPRRTHVLTGRERHTIAQDPPSNAGYPMRAIRTHDFLYIRNFTPDRWPSGGPARNYRDCDGSPTKTFMVKHRKDRGVRRFFDLAFAKRPAEELYDLAGDPHQLVNVAGQRKYAEVQARLSRQLIQGLKATGDPRLTDGASRFDDYPYFGRRGPPRKKGKKKGHKKGKTKASKSTPGKPGPSAGKVSLLNRPYDQVAFLVTHNAMSNRAEGWLFPNQSFGLSRQLKDGVRGLMLDVHLVNGQPHLVHSKPLLGKRPLAEGLREITGYLARTPDAVVTIIFESYVDAALIRRSFEAAGLFDQLHRQQPGKPWPTLKQMIAAKRRLVVFTDRGGGGFPGYHDVWKFCWETHFSVSRVQDFRFDRNRGRARNRLLILNHFLTKTIGSSTLAKQANVESVLGPRVRECRARTGRLPNFVVVDFYEIGDARGVVARFNRRRR